MTSRQESPGRTEEERSYYSFSERAYAIFAHVYDAVVFPFKSLRREVASVVELPPGARLLDVATGTGQQAAEFASKAHEVVGIDLSKAMLRVARRKNRFGNVSFQRGDAAELPWEDESFDASCVSFALHEMPRSVRERVVREMARVTKVGGFVIVVDYGLPKSQLVSALAQRVIRLYETDYYTEFLKSDWHALLRSVGVETSSDRAALGGLARILAGRRTAAATHVRPDSGEPNESPRPAGAPLAEG